MTRTISVSTCVFAAIWTLRKEGEETEDAILRRILKLDKKKEPDLLPLSGNTGVGIHDTRNNVHFDQGFEVFRNYKGKQYSAKALDRMWVRQDTGERFPTLNQLNASIVAGAENVWNGNWRYRTADGKDRSIHALRKKGLRGS